MESQNVRYMPAVDHLRLFAALLVVLVHGFDHFDPKAYPWPHPQHWPALMITEGYTGVTLFMVLSGFILTYAAYGKHVSYGPFLRNRALRLLPLLLVVFAIAATTSPSSISPQLLWITLLPTQAWGLGSFSVVAWSIFVEIELYLMFPVLLRHLNEGGPRRLLGVMALVMGFRFVALSASTDHFGLLYFSVLSRADQFILGMLAAWALRRYSTRLWVLLAPFGMTLTMLLLASFNRTGGSHPSGGSALGQQWGVLSPTLEGVGWACVVVGYVAVMQGVTGTITRTVARLGATSYSIYLLHMMVIDALRANHVGLNVGATPFQQAMVTTVMIVVPLTLVASRLSYNLIELPFLRRRVRWVEEPHPVAALPIPLQAVG